MVVTWSSLLVCRSRWRRKERREALRTRMRSVVPSPRWAAGDRPWGLRGHAQLMLTALIARKRPRTLRQASPGSGVRGQGSEVRVRGQSLSDVLNVRPSS